VTTRTDVYLAAVAAVILLAIGLTILITGAFTTTEVGPTIITGTITTTAGSLATLTAGYRAARHHTREHTNRAAAALIRDILTHDAHIAAEPPDAKIVPLDGVQARRQPRESTT
jgi:membrane protein implicated in regulation of membrane protease activity